MKNRNPIDGEKINYRQSSREQGVNFSVNILFFLNFPISASPVVTCYYSPVKREKYHQHL